MSLENVVSQTTALGLMGATPKKTPLEKLIELTLGKLYEKLAGYYDGFITYVKEKLGAKFGTIYNYFKQGATFAKKGLAYVVTGGLYYGIYKAYQGVSKLVDGVYYALKEMFGPEKEMYQRPMLPPEDPRRKTIESIARGDRKYLRRTG